jgi:Ca2+-binding RTX toxin-like protein
MNPRRKPFDHRPRLALEALEHRLVPAGSCLWTPPGTLTVTTTPGNDTVTVRIDTHGTASTSDDEVEVRMATAGMSDVPTCRYGVSQVSRIVFHGQAGNDVFDNRLTSIRAQAHGSSGDDLLYGGSGDDDLRGEDGNDRLYGMAGWDHLRGGDGNDALYGLAGDDILEGGDGRDSLEGGDGNDRLSGNDGVDALWGVAGNDRLDGGYDNDRDFLHGGAGFDVFVRHTWLFPWSGTESETNADYNPAFGDTVATTTHYWWTP